MSVLSKATDTASLLLEGLDAIAHITSSPTIKTAEEIVAAIKAVLTSLEKATAGHVTPDAVRAELAALQTAIADNDARADKALADKFDRTDTP